MNDKPDRSAELLRLVPPDEPPPTEQQLDEDEAALRALRLDLPGTAGAPTGIVAISVTTKLPRNEFFRTHPENTAVFTIVDHAVGMDIEFHLVAPAMVAALASIGIDVVPYRVFEVITSEGAVRLVVVRQADVDGSQNEWNRSKEIALTRAQASWVRAISDRTNGRYRVWGGRGRPLPRPGERAKAFPQIAPLHELRHTLSKLRSIKPRQRTASCASASRSCC